MSTTLASARTRLRTWLEDTSGAPLWSDGELDEGLHQALDTYSMYAPHELTATVAAVAGDTALSLPAECGPVVRVTDPNGWVIPRRLVPARYGGGEELAWERWGDDLVFSRALTAGNYAVRYYGARVLPTVAGNAVPIPDVDVSLLVAGAALWLIEERMREEWKRGPLPARYESRRDAARQDYRALLDAFRRRLRTRPLESTG